MFSAVDGYVGFASDPRQTTVYFNLLDHTAYFKHNQLLIQDNADGSITRIISSVQVPDQQYVSYVAAVLSDKADNKIIRLYRYDLSDDIWEGVSDFPTGARRINGAIFLPMSEKGMILYFLHATMREILLFDIESQRWFLHVVNSGDVPDYREAPCVVVASATDGSSHQVNRK